MASNYKFSNEEMAAIKAARRETKDKRADARYQPRGFTPGIRTGGCTISGTTERAEAGVQASAS